MGRRISEERRVAYYTGIAMITAGLTLCGSTIVIGALHSTRMSTFTTEFAPPVILFMVGMGLMLLGAIVRGIGARGLAGSGVVLDPEKARKDLEPYSRMAGGMVKDALDEANLRPAKQPQRVVMIKCSSCGRLNEEDSKFCQECGK